LVLLFLTTFAPAISAQNFSRTFSVSTEPGGLEVINQSGSIKVSASAANTGKIVINAKKIDGDAQINATQTPQGKVKVEVTGLGAIDFEISVPPAANLDLFTYKGTISVANLTGSVRARITTDGNIQFTGLRSSKVEAHSSSGNVIFSGETLPNGEYILKSFSGRVEVTFPANADFRLSASSFSGVMDLGGFPLKFDRQTNQLVEAACGTGRSKVFLWTQEGSIHLRRKP
jgi:DUF4097 and DUF4098 domain-containing protein YvlB